MDAGVSSPDAAPRVSVVIPTYQRRGLVEEAIDGALAQTMSDLEVVVVDDGSTDGTADHLRARYADEPRLRVIEKPNGGSASARNRGLQEVRGAWVAFLDSDDLWKPGYLASQLAVLARDDVDAVLGDADYDGIDRAEHQFGDPVWREPTSLDAMLGGGWGLPSALVVRAAIARDVGFDESYAFSEDTVFLLGFHHAGHRLALNRERHAVWRAGRAVRKNDELEFAHQFAQVRMLQPYRERPLVRRTLRRLHFGMQRQLGAELRRAGFWHEARPHLAAVARRRWWRVRAVVRWLRSCVARPSPEPLPPSLARRSQGVLESVRRYS